MEVGAVGVQIIKILFYILSGTLVLTVVGAGIWYARQQAMFKDLVIIRSLDKNGNLQINLDRGGILKSRKTGTEMYMLRKNKKAKIGVDTIRYTFTDKGRKIVELFYNSNGNYTSLNPTIHDNVIEYQTSQADVDWAIEQFTAYQKAFASQSKLWQLLPYLGITLMFIALIVIGIYLIKAYPQLIGGVSSAAQHLAEAAKAQAGIIQ